MGGATKVEAFVEPALVSNIATSIQTLAFLLMHGPRSWYFIPASLPLTHVRVACVPGPRRPQGFTERLVGFPLGLGKIIRKVTFSPRSRHTECVAE